MSNTFHQDHISWPGPILAFDCGASSLKAAIIDIHHPTHIVCNPEKIPFDIEITDFARKLANMGDKLIKDFGKGNPAGIGIAIPGPFAYEDGVSHMEHKFQGLRGHELKSVLAKSLAPLLEERPEDLESRIFLLNDAHAFAIGARWMLSPSAMRFVAITLGTGLGASFLVNGIPALPAQGAPESGEIWDFPYPDPHPSKLTLEDFTSRARIRVEYAKAKNPAGVLDPLLTDNDTLNDLKIPDVDKIAEEASKGGQEGEAARKAFEFLGEHLARGLVQTAFGFTPDLIAIGGQIANAWSHIQESFEKTLRNLGWDERIVRPCNVETIKVAALHGIAQYVASRLNPPHLLVVPNEDGLGPSSLAYYVVRESIERQRLRRMGGAPCRTIIRNKGKLAYNRAIYASAIKAGWVSCDAIHSIIELGKKAGRLGLEESLTNLLQYEQGAHLYATVPLTSGGSPCIGVIDIGSPAATRAAWMDNVPRITIFDHMWSTSFEKFAHAYNSDMTFSEGNKQVSELVQRAIGAIRADESKTNVVFLFPRFLTPDEYHQGWRQTPAIVIEIGGVLGGRPPLLSALVEGFFNAIGVPKPGSTPVHELSLALSYDISNDIKMLMKQTDLQEDILRRMQSCLAEILSRDNSVFPDYKLIKEMIRQFGSTSTCTAAFTQTLTVLTGRKAARESIEDYVKGAIVRYLLDIDNDDPIVFVSGGGTAVWTAQMYEKIVTDALALEGRKMLSFNILVCAPGSVFKTFGLGNRQKTMAASRLNSIKLQFWQPCDRTGRPSTRIRFLGDITDGTYQEIFPGIDLIVTRAGGGTVNDAIACRTPICCVEEPGHWQVEAIRANMEKQGLTRTISLDAFRDDPVAVIYHELIEERGRNRELTLNMKKIPNEREKFIVDNIIQFLYNRKDFFAIHTANG